MLGTGGSLVIVGCLPILPKRDGTGTGRHCLTLPDRHQAVLPTHLQSRLRAIRLTEGV